MSDSKMCEHEQIETHVLFARLTNIAGEVSGEYRVDVQVRCGVCGVRFQWLGVPHGYSDSPTVSLDGFVLNAPMKPDAHMTSMMAGDPVTGWPGQ